jgi:hypothetical protein
MLAVKLLFWRRSGTQGVRDLRKNVEGGGVAAGIGVSDLD